MQRLLFILLTGLCGVLNGLAPAERETPADCSENPYYAEANMALDWYAQNPESAPNYAQGYSHAVLDGAYDSLSAEGKVPPVPPACTVTVLTTTPLYEYLGGTSKGDLAVGTVGQLYGRSEDYAWWNVLIEGVGWGWVRAQDVALQPETEIDLIPIH